VRHRERQRKRRQDQQQGGYDNFWANLRECTDLEQQQNRRLYYVE